MVPSAMSRGSHLQARKAPWGESRGCHLSDKRLTVNHEGKGNCKGGKMSCQKNILSGCILFSSSACLKGHPRPASRPSPSIFTLSNTEPRAEKSPGTERFLGITRKHWAAFGPNFTISKFQVKCKPLGAQPLPPPFFSLGKSQHPISKKSVLRKTSWPSDCC